MNTVENTLLILLYCLLLQCCNSSDLKLDERCQQKPKYGETFLLPNGVIGYNNYEYGWSCSKATGKSMAVYFNGIGCLQCRSYEEKYFSNNEILSRLNEDYIFISILIDDKRELPKHEQGQYESKVFDVTRTLRTIANYNLSLLDKYQHSSTPTLFLVDESERILSRLTNDETIDGFLLELDKGKQKNKRYRDIHSY